MSMTGGQWVEIEKGLMWQSWPAQNATAHLILVHGMGAPTSRWEELGQFFAAQGFEVSAIQMRGWGKNTGKTPGHINSFKTYYRDIHKLIAHKLSEKNLPVFGLGESMGALILLGMQFFYPQDFRGIVLFSPALKDILEISISKKIFLWIMLLLNPRYQYKMPFNPEMTTRDSAMIKMMREDANEKHIATPSTLFQILITRFKAYRLAHRFKLPILIAQGGHDFFMDKSATEAFSKKTCEARYQFYPEMFHGLSIDLDREKVFKDTLSWLKSIQAR